LSKEKSGIDKLKGGLLGHIAHEARIPLSIAKEGVNVVLDGLTGKVNEKQKKLLLTAKENVNKAARIINDFIDILRIETGELALRQEEVDLKNVTEETVAFFEPMIRKKGLDIALKIPKKALKVAADTYRIRQILSTLIENAADFTAEGAVEISISEVGDMAEFSIADVWSGLAEEDLSKMLEMYNELWSRTGTRDKTAVLDFYIIKETIRMQEGEVCIEAKGPDRARFTFTLPKHSDKLVKK